MPIRETLRVSVPRGDFGVVRVVHGLYKDRLAYYAEDSNDFVYVYFDKPLASRSTRLTRTSIAPATDAETKEWHRRFF